MEILYPFLMLFALGAYVWYRVVFQARRFKNQALRKQNLALQTQIRNYKRAQHLLVSEKQVLEIITSDISLTGALDILCKSAEEHLNNTLCSILWLDRDGHRLQYGAAPSLPESFLQGCHGITLIPKVGTHGTADRCRILCLREDNTATHPCRRQLQQLALKYGLRGCWSVPIFSSYGKMVGIFALYYRLPHCPDSYELHIIDRVTHLAGIAITRKQMEEQLMLYRAIIRNSKDGIGITDLEGHYLEQNPSHRGILGYLDEELLGKTPALHLGEKTFSHIFRTLQSQGYYRGEIRSCAKNGNVIDIELTAFLVKNDNTGKPLCTAGIKRDITQRKQGEATLRIRAETDFLTKIYNRQKLCEILEQEIVRIKRHPRPLALLLFDIDYFKQINDQHGHPTGDQILQEIAALVQEKIRAGDIFARYGGEEFTVLTLDSGLDEASLLAEKLRQAICNHQFIPTTPITCSFGIADFQPGENMEDLIKNADKALYQAKRKGRNKIVFHKR